MRQWVTSLVLAVVAGGCAGSSQRSLAPMRHDARQLMVAGDLAATDSSLTACSRAHPTDAEGSHCRYWLVFARLDPAHPGPPAGAVEAARDFLARDGDAPGREEITLLLRVATQRESLLASLDSSRTMLASRAAAVQTPLRDDPGDREVEKLRAELAKTQDELQRIKRRLSAPRP